MEPQSADVSIPKLNIPIFRRSELSDCVHRGRDWLECFAAGDSYMLGVRHRHKVNSAKKDETGNPVHQCRDKCFILTTAFAQEMVEAKTNTELASPTPELKEPPVLGSIPPEDLPPLFPEFTDWLKRERIRVYGWIEGGYTHSSAGDGFLANAPTPNRFGNEAILNGVWLIVERQLAKEGWSWGFRSDFYAGSDAALLHPQNGFGPEDLRWGTDFRQLYLSLHMPVLSEGGVDLQLGRQNVPIGYETLMAPYRPMYSDTYFWIHFQVGSTSAIANWHATKQLDLLAGVIMGYNTFFDLRGDSPCYLAKAIYSFGPEKQTKVSAAVCTGPEPFPVATGHLGSWQTHKKISDFLKSRPSKR